MKTAKDMPDSTKPTLASDEHTRQRRGTGRLTLRDVAIHLGISQISVSRYFQDPSRLSKPLRERIAQAVVDLGYMPNLVAGGLASSHSKVIGMVIPNISGPIFAATIQSFSDAVTAHGYQLLLASSYFSKELEENAVRGLLGWSPAALVVTSRFHSAGTEAMLAGARMPIVETWDYRPRRKPLQVGFSHAAVGRMAAQHLLERGCKRIAFVPNSAPGDLSAMERRDGYAELMREHGREPWCYVPTAAQPAHAGREALEVLMAVRAPADAIIFANDNLASGALLAAQRVGIPVPQQVAIVGFGDYPFSEMLTPSLTTIRPPARDIGLIAADLIFRMLDGDAPTTRSGQPRSPEALLCKLVVRESS